MVGPPPQDTAARLIGIIFGPPGSGKGTQAARIEAEFNLKHLSTGEILRAEVARGTPIGKEAGRIMAAGDLVPDKLIVDIVRGRLPEAEAGAGVLLDHYARQGVALERINGTGMPEQVFDRIRRAIVISSR